MALAPSYLTWDGDGGSILPRRPSTDDLGGDDKIDDAEFPPNDVEHPTAAGWNQQVDQLSAICKTVAASKLEVRITAGTPAVARASGPRSTIAPGTFTVVDNGVGDTSITWPANTFPAHQISPTGLTMLSNADARGALEEITNGIRVRTFNSAGTAADINWTVTIN